MVVHLGRRGPGHQARVGPAVGDGPDSTPDAFELGQVNSAALGVDYDSNTVLVTGASMPATVSIVGGEYALNGGPWTTTPGSANPGDAVQVRRTAAVTVATATEAVLTIGGVSDAFTVTTANHAETSALALRFTADPGDARRGLIDDCIGELKAEGLWAKLDAFYMMAAHDAQAARCNWRQDAFNLTPVNGPTFEADLGYTGVPAAQAYLDTGFNDLTGSALWSQDDMCAGAYVNLAPPSANSFLSLAAASSVRIGATPTQLNTRIHCSSSFNISFANAVPGHVAVTRDSATTSRCVRNGAQVGSVFSLASTASSDSNVTAFRSINSYNGDRMACMHLGAALSNAELASLYGAILTYLTALGAA